MLSCTCLQLVQKFELKKFERELFCTYRAETLRSLLERLFPHQRSGFTPRQQETRTYSSETSTEITLVDEDHLKSGWIYVSATNGMRVTLQIVITLDKLPETAAM